MEAYEKSTQISPFKLGRAATLPSLFTSVSWASITPLAHFGATGIGRLRLQRTLTPNIQVSYWCSSCHAFGGQIH
jgi:hypothetical protein